MFLRKEATHVRHEDAISEMEGIYEMGAILGKGSFGVVYGVESKITKKTFACKVIKKKIGLLSAYEQQEREVNIMKTLIHPNILLLHEVYESPNSVAMILELCDGGEIAQVISEPGFCSDEVIRPIISQLVDAVTYLHRARIIHRDIKPENILLKKKWKVVVEIKIADFGLACQQNNQVYDFAGTPLYMAPEILQKTGYNHSCDIWSIGVLLYLLLCKYDRQAEAPFINLLQNGKIEYREELWGDLSPKAKQLCQQILVFDPAKRISAGEIQMHPWIKMDENPNGTEQSVNVLDLMKLYNAERRLRKVILVVSAAVRFKSLVQKRQITIITDNGEKRKSYVFPNRTSKTVPLPQSNGNR